MLTPDDRILVAVSGGKDSLAVWDMLLELGYRPTGCTSVSASATTATTAAATPGASPPSAG